MYILECCDGSYYTGSTKNIEIRLVQHQAGEGANHTKKRLPVKLVYYEEYPRIDDAFYREKQVQGWSRKKKDALIRGDFNQLPELAKAYRDVASRASATAESRNSATSIPLPEALEGNEGVEG
jgi:putative endonuclease